MGAISAKVLVAGASGALGSEVVAALKTRDAWVRSLSRSAANATKLRGVADEIVLGNALQPESIAGICKDVDYVISTMGASVSTAPGDRVPFSMVDAVANRNLLAEAERAKVKKFVYVAVYTQPGYAQSRYMQAHEAFVSDLRNSGLAYTVIRPTGFFTALEEFLNMARLGLMPLFGGGTAKTNPIHNADLALVCVAALQAKESEIAAGGPEILTRKQIGELAFAALGKQPRFLPLPVFLLTWLSKLVRIVHPRMGELLEFVAGVSVHDCVAPGKGTRRLGEYYRQIANEERSRSDRQAA